LKTTPIQVLKTSHAGKEQKRDQEEATHSQGDHANERARNVDHTAPTRMAIACINVDGALLNAHTFFVLRSSFFESS